MAKLASLPVVVHPDGRRLRCSECVDPDDSVFSRLMEGADFDAMLPPAVYASNPDALAAMRAAGMASLLQVRFPWPPRPNQGPPSPVP